MIMDECPKKTDDYDLIKKINGIYLYIGLKDQKKHLEKILTKHSFWYYSRRLFKDLEKSLNLY